MSTVLPKGLNRQVAVMGLISLLADIAGEMLTPVTPMFLTVVLGASAAQVGLIEGVADGIANILKTFSGRWSDLIRRRKPFIVCGYMLAALAKPSLGFASSWGSVLLGRAMDRFGKGLREAPRDALLVDSVPAGERASAFGWHRGLDTFGAVLGPLLALLLIAKLDGDLRAVYFIAFIPGLCAVLLTSFLREPPHDPLLDEIEPRAVQRRNLPRSFWTFQLIWGLFCLGNFSDAFLILRARDIGFSQTETVLVYCLHSLVYSLSSPFVGRLADRYDKKTVIAFGFLVFSVVYAGFASATGYLHVTGMFFLYGFYAAATEGVGKSLAVDLLPAEARGFGLGIMGAVTGFAALFSSVLAGYLWDRSSPVTAFYLGSACALLAAVLLWRVKLEPLRSC